MALNFWNLIGYMMVPLILSDTAAASTLNNKLSPKDIYRKYSKAVVLIASTHKGKKNSTLGTGTIIASKKDIFIITNTHVIFDDLKNMPFSKISIYLKPERVMGSWKEDLKRKYTGEIVSYDTQLDLALLKIKNDGTGTFIPFADSDKTEIGEPVVAIGHPEQGGLWTLTTGMISAQKAALDKIEGKDVFQTDANINRGNSGGPLLNLSGELVGINTSIVRRAVDGMAITGINFSIKSNTVSKWLRKGGYTFAGLMAKKQKTVKKQKIIGEQKTVEMKEKDTPPEKMLKSRILTKKRPYKFNDLVGFLMMEMEDSIDRAMDDMWNKWN